MKTPSASRRQFIRASIGSAALTAASYNKVLGANDRVGIGFIGFGLIGKRHVLDFSEQPDVRIVAMCDAHGGRLAEGCQLAGGCRGYSDFRKLLGDRDVDAVVISTPDHWHALMTMLACAAGKDVYVEKPLSLFVREGQWMIDVAHRANRVVQVGTQQRSGRHYQRARQLIADGAIGRVHSVRMHAYRNVMPGFGSPADCEPPPKFDWDAFLGPAPWRPYNPNRGIYHFRWLQYAGAHPVGGPKRTETASTDEYWTTSLEDTGSEREQFTGHVRNFLDCVKSRSTPISDLESAHRVSTMCHLANLSLRMGRKLRWHADRQAVADDAAVNGLLRRPYRAPWDAEIRALGVS